MRTRTSACGRSARAHAPGRGFWPAFRATPGDPHVRRKGSRRCGFPWARASGLPCRAPYGLTVFAVAFGPGRAVEALPVMPVILVLWWLAPDRIYCCVLVPLKWPFRGRQLPSSLELVAAPPEPFLRYRFKGLCSRRLRG